MFGRDLREQVVDIVADADEDLIGLVGTPAGGNAGPAFGSLAKAQGRGVEMYCGVLLLVQPRCQGANGGPGVHAQVIRQECAAADAVGVLPAELGPDLFRIEHGDLAGRAGIREFAQQLQLGFGRGNYQRAGFGSPESGLVGKAEPVSSSCLGEVVEFAVLRGNAGMAEVADRGADGAVVAVDDGDAQARLVGQASMGEADNACADDQYVAACHRFLDGRGIHIGDVHGIDIC